MSSSADIARRMYQQLGPDGLAARTNEQCDRQVVRRVESLLGGPRRVLDLGCGYGRIAVALAAAGHDVTGVDICPAMLERARSRAERAGAAVRWIEGDLCRLQLEDDSFDAVLCLWLTFNELYRREEQLAALREICRVLRPGGTALIDGPPFEESVEQRSDLTLAAGDSWVDDGISRRWAPPAGNAAERAYEQLLREAGAARHELSIDDCSGRPRYWLQVWA